MSKEDNGGSAFPSGERYQTYHHMSGSYSDHSKAPLHAGMTLRDWFAGQALIHIQATDKDGVMSPEITAFACYRLADAMLEARNK